MRNFQNGCRNSIRRCAILLVTAGTAANARAQPPEQPGPRGIDQPERVTDNHVFASPAFMPTPFPSTHFSFAQGVTQVTVADFPITQDIRLDVDLLGLNERIEAGVRFADRFEVFGFVSGEVLSGSSGRSVVAA